MKPLFLASHLFKVLVSLPSNSCRSANSRLPQLGYDGVHPFAVQNSYGGPHGLQRLVNACHEQGLSIFLDVVYNHVGPEGSCLSEFGSYFTDRYRTSWGHAINLGDMTAGALPRMMRRICCRLNALFYDPENWKNYLQVQLTDSKNGP